MNGGLMVRAACGTWWLFIALLAVPPAELRGAVDARFLSPQAKVIGSFKVPQALDSAAGADVRQWVVEAFYGCPMAEAVLAGMSRIQFSATHAGEREERKTEWLVAMDGVDDWPSVQDCVRMADYQETSHRGVPVMTPANRRSKAASVAYYAGRYVLLAGEAAPRAAGSRTC
jgi:hypothetical protein